MSILRSEKMGLYHIAMSKESAYEVLSELGDLNNIQFIDQTPNESQFTRPFSKGIKRCEDIEARLQAIRAQAKKYKAEITPCKNIQGYLDNLKEQLNERQKASHTYIDEVEALVENKEEQLGEQIKNFEKFQEQILQLHEYRAVLQHSKEVLSEHLYGRQNNLNVAEDEESKDGVLSDLAVGLNYMAGVINTNDLLRFKRMVFRATRSNSWTSSGDIAPFNLNPQKDIRKEMEDPEDVEIQLEETDRKACFLIIYQSGTTGSIKNKIIRIADSFGCTRYPLPADPSNYMKKMMEIEGQILEYSNTSRLTARAIEQMLKEWTEPKGKGQYSWIEELSLFMTREKALYTNMNLLNIKNEIYDGYYWCPEILANDVENSIRVLHNRKVELPQTTITPKDRKHKKPPTHFQTNDFTRVFQEIVDTYGIARYQEINPGIFCCLMFPVKFGIMFGDIGHGGLLLAAGALMTYYGDVLKANGMEAIAEVRYLFLLMGVFAFYCGFIYNDFFSIPFNLFGSCFKNVEGTAVTEIVPNCVYPLGLDPKWYVAKNELSFMNSLKMKLAVIIGVVQMLWGIVLKGCNALYHSEYVDFFFEFIPQFVFLVSTFGYMDFMIFYKWSTYYPDTSEAPSIISQMINLPLKGGTTEGTAVSGHGNLWDQASQESLQINLLIIALCCVPLMLFPKPIILYFQNKVKQDKKPKTHSKGGLQDSLLQNQEESNLNETLKAKKAEAEGLHDDDEEEEFEFGEVAVHSIIETIEFVLGCISNTASYLRLWALSLAHGQLAKVFFQKTIGGGIQTGNIISILIGWFLFVNITLGVIMAMDLMECFLHALRLQWVEFQNKFYKADGYKFEPFSFHNSLKQRQIEIAQGN